ncbi:prepilin peptidase [uncultured Friedmanniella sp.]|uniref:prepilin peptidase n=1 Tax=uncultured Friedmanniella sp. TaxID=335381 RepID=UPI0035CB5215
MSWLCVLLAAGLGLAAALWLRTRRYRYDDDLVRRTLAPGWLPVTAAAGALLGTPFYAGVPAAVAVTYVVALVWGLTLAFIDLEVHRLPDVLTLRAYPVGAVLLALCSLVAGNWTALARAALCAGVAVAVFTLLVLVSGLFYRDGDGFGWGDAKLSGGLAGLLGWFSWSNAFYGLVTGCLVAGVVAVALILNRRARTSHVSYGPPLILGAYLWALLLPA